MQNTNINWTELTWNPMSGCKKVSAECKHCYAFTLAEQRRGTKAFPRGFDLHIRPHKLVEPSKVKKPSLIFCNSMSDPGLEEVSDEYRDRIFDAIEASPEHRYQMLTKRPDRLLRYFRTRGRRVPESVWIGVTIGVRETQWRADVLREFDAPVKFISAEPLLEDLTVSLDGIAWLISGGESGSHASNAKELARRFLVRRGEKGEPRWVAREDRKDWIRHLRDRCDLAGTAFWHKQWGGPRPESGGRDLDGRTHNGLPSHIPGAMPDAYEHMRRAKKFARQLPLVS